MNKKTGKIITITLVSVVALVWGSRLFHVWDLRKIPTDDNEPTLKTNAIIFSLNFIKPKRSDLYSFIYTDLTGQQATFVKRICGMPGDIVELRSKVLYVNKENFDKNLTLNHLYIVHKEFAEELIRDRVMKVKDVHFIEDLDSALIVTTDQAMNEEKRGHSYKKKDHSTAMIRQYWAKPWDDSDFGPIEIPEGKYFMLGDNRDNSFDSRFFGLVDENDMIGLVRRQ